MLKFCHYYSFLPKKGVCARSYRKVRKTSSLFFISKIDQNSEARDSVFSSFSLLPRAEPQSGHLLTFAQFLFVAVEGFIYHFDPKSPTLLKPNTIPIHRWLVQILLYFSVSILNNYAFGYKISVPVHIILRSGGSMTTLVIGWLWGKRF